MDNITLIEALRVVSGNKDIQTSGNLEHQLRQFEIEVAIELADVSYPGKKKTDSEEGFVLGLELGREIRDKIVYMIDLDSDILYFVGTEADIIRKIEDKKEELGIGGDEDLQEKLENI